jgi:hypothetical protein
MTLGCVQAVISDHGCAVARAGLGAAARGCGLCEACSSSFFSSQWVVKVLQVPFITGPGVLAPVLD